MVERGFQNVFMNLFLSFCGDLDPSVIADKRDAGPPHNRNSRSESICLLPRNPF